MACAADCLAVGEPATGGKSDLYEFDGSPSRAVARDEASPRKRGGESIPHHQFYEWVGRSNYPDARDAGRLRLARTNLIYHEIASSYPEALAREAFLKSGQGRQWLVRQTVSP